MKKAVFLDRDGVINEDNGYVGHPDEFILIPTAIKALKKLQKLNYKIIIITNQSGIGRGLYSEDDMHAVHDKMVSLLSKEGITFDEIFFCPHDPDDNCNCRKPSTGMLEKAKEKHNIDFSKSFFVGDRTSDILAGNRCGCTTILVKTGEGGKDGRSDVKPNYIVEDILGAVEIISGSSKD